MNQIPTQHAGHLEIVAVLRSEETRAAVAASLDCHGHTVKIIMGPLKPAVARIFAMPGLALPDLLLIDIDIGDKSEMDVLAGIINAYGDKTSIAVTSAQSTADSILALVHMGATDLIPQPLKAEDLLHTLAIASERKFRRTALGDRRRRRSEQGEPAARGNVISFLKGGGGAGATTLLVQGACALDPADRASTLVLDLDLQFGSAAQQLDLPEKTSLLDLFQAGDRIDGTMLHSAAAVHKSGVSVLAAPPAIQPLSIVTAEMVLRLLDAARSEFKTVLVDLPTAWDAWTHAVISASDAIILVIQPTVTSIRHGRRQIETLGEEGLDMVPLTVVANRLPKSGLFSEAKSVAIKDAEQALRCPISHCIPQDQAVVDAALLGQTLSDVPGGKRLVKLLNGIFAQVRTTAPAPSRAKV